MKKQRIKCVNFRELPESLKAQALNKALRLDYSEAQAQALYFNYSPNDITKLLPGVIDKGFTK